MKHHLHRPNDKTVRALKKDSESLSHSQAKETNPLLRETASSFSRIGGGGPGSNLTEAHGGSFRARCSGSLSPSGNQHFRNETSYLNSTATPMYQATDADAHDSELGDGSADYTEITYHAAHRSQNAAFDEASQNSHLISQVSSTSSRNGPQPQMHATVQDTASTNQSIANNDQQHPPLLEIPEEIYAVRKSALRVLKPLTRTWVVITVGFSLSVLFGMTRWTELIVFPYWFILLPSWGSHVGLLWCHVLSARALSKFISEANDSRQRADSRDHLNRTEYLPLLQRSLKFGLKTGLLSFCVFVFEILIYSQLAWKSISLAAVFSPLWLIVVGGILDGLICKTQHSIRVLCWLLVFLSMILTVLKVDSHIDAIRWRFIISPIVALLSILSGTLIYIVYGHQTGFYQLTESQLTAGNLYSLAALICIVLFVVIGEVIPRTPPVEVATKLFMVVMAPLSVCLVGMGAWVVSRDEFGRLLLYGGQAAVHPMKLRWESTGWTSVQGKGVTSIPMFGEVSFRPLQRGECDHVCSACKRCTWYPYEKEEESLVGIEDLGNHPYLTPSPSPALRINDVLRIR